jgi:hypothetical protein
LICSPLCGVYIRTPPPMGYMGPLPTTGGLALLSMKYSCIYNYRPQINCNSSRCAAWITLLTNNHFFSLFIRLPIVKNTGIFLLPQSSRRRNRLPPPSPLHLFSQAFCSYPLFASCSDDGTAYVFHGTVYSDLNQNPLVVPLEILRGHASSNGRGESFAYLLLLSVVLLGGNEDCKDK